MIRFFYMAAVFFFSAQLAIAAPVLKKKIFEFNSRVFVQEEFLILTNETVLDPTYTLSELRIQLNENKSYDGIGLYDKIFTTYGQAVAYNTNDIRWRKFKNKLLYVGRTSASASKFEVIPFRVMNPDGQTSDWGEIRLSLGGQYDQKYDYYPQDDISTALTNQSVDINVLANDPDVQEYYRVEIYASPNNGKVSLNADKTIRYISSSGFVGRETFSYRVAGNNLYDIDSAPATVTVYVQPPNNPPQISGDPDFRVYAGKKYSFTPQATDLDNEPLIFSIVNKPGWATFNVSNGTLSGTPTSADIGDYAAIQILVTDGKDTSSLLPFNIAVKNNPPTISGSPQGAVNISDEYLFTPITSDADGDALTFSISNLPGFLTFNRATGKLSGVPSNIGTYPNITISVSDGVDSASLEPFDLTVNNAPTPPAIPSTVTANVSGDDITVSWTRVSGATHYHREVRVNGGSWKNQTRYTGTSATFANQKPGSYQYRVNACNTSGCSGWKTSNSVTISTGDNAAPTVTPLSPNKGQSFSTTQEVIATASAQDASPGTVAAVEFRLNSGNWQSDASSPYSKNFGKLSAGSHTLYYRAKDNEGKYSATAAVKVEVKAQGGGGQPTKNALVKYEYDDVGRLIRVRVNGRVVVEYTLDNDDNRADTTYTEVQP